MPRMLSLRVALGALLLASPAAADRVATPVAVYLDGHLTPSAVQLVFEREPLAGPFEAFAAAARTPEDAAFARAVRVLRAGKGARPAEVLDLSRSPGDPEAVFAALAVGYRGFPDLRMLGRVRLGGEVAYFFDYRSGTDKAERIVRGLVVTPAGRVRPITDAEPTLGLLQWGHRAWHRAGRPTATPPAAGKRLPVQAGQPVEIVYRETWRGRHALDGATPAPTVATEALRRALQAFEAGDFEAFAGYFTPESKADVLRALQTHREQLEGRRGTVARSARAEVEIDLGEAGWLVLFTRGTEDTRVLDWQYVLRTPQGPRLANFAELDPFEGLARRSGLAERLRQPAPAIGGRK